MWLAWLLLGVVVQVCSAGDAIEQLTDDSFIEAIKDSDSTWLVDFYAPWCSSCVHLEPILNDAAVEAKSFLRIAKVNVDANPKLAAKYEIVRYPTIMYGRWNARMNEVELKPYPGDRSVDSLVKFGKRMAGDVVSSITSDKEWEQYFSVDGSMLVFGQSAQPDAKEVEMLELYKKTAAFFQNQHIFTTTNDAKMLAKFSRPAPFVARIDSNQKQPYYYDGDLALPKMNRYPSFTTFENSNFKRIGSFRILVVGCYLPERDASFESLFQSFASYSNSLLTPSERERFAFGWINSTRYEHYLTKFFVYSDQLPTFFVWNTEAQVFYNYEGPHDAESMRQFLSNILVGKERAIGQANYPLKIYRYFVRGYPWTLLWLIPGSIVLFFIGLGFYGFLKYDDKAEKRALAQISQGTSKAKKDE
ncbi:hypothetical protein AeMF1_001066 [Aphanomyces euteiches]|nr:hypothetical protein AeMF1_001066 [Aphanomyces euteiches]KAH9190569.1 hypothetical protein AeNC1_007456 [Aphanomyces euteiches]